MEFNLYRLVEYADGTWSVEQCVGGGHWKTISWKTYATQEEARAFADSLKIKRRIDA